MADDERRLTAPDRELDELLGEIRVILPAVTVLFAFLLSLPFTAQFKQLSDVTEGAYIVAFSACGAAIVLLAGETAYHRLRGKPYDKQRMIVTASRQAATALALLAVALSAVAFVVFDLVYGTIAAVAAAVVALALAVTVWFALPVARRIRG